MDDEVTCNSSGAHAEGYDGDYQDGGAYSYDTSTLCTYGIEMDMGGDYSAFTVRAVILMIRYSKAFQSLVHFLTSCGQRSIRCSAPDVLVTPHHELYVSLRELTAARAWKQRRRGGPLSAAWRYAVRHGAH